MLSIVAFILMFAVYRQFTPDTMGLAMQLVVITAIAPTLLSRGARNAKRQARDVSVG